MNPKHPTLQDCLQAVGAHYGILPEELVGQTKPRHVAHPRQLFYLLASTCTHHSLSSIAKFCNRLDHTSVLHGIRAVRQRMEQDANLELTYRTLVDQVTRQQETAP